MTVQLNYRPRLIDLHWLVPVGMSATDAEATLEARRKTPRISRPEMFEGRKGYRADFLGDFVVPWPKPVGARNTDVVKIAVSPDNRLDYTNFSVTMSTSRRLALCVGVNINGAESVNITRGEDKWAFDGRIPIELQAGDDLYADNLLNRGHLVRREDPNWGENAATANEDSFHFTNCAPQMAAFNQKTWLSLEDYVLKNTRRWKERVTVFSGPVFRDDDPLYRDMRIPTAFWKVVAFLSDDGRPSATAYMIDQSQELVSLEAAFGRFRTYQCSVVRIEKLTQLDFGPLSQFDGFSNEERATNTCIEAVVRSASDIRV